MNKRIRFNPTDFRTSVIPAYDKGAFSIDEIFDQIGKQLGSFCTNIRYSSSADGHFHLSAESSVPFFYDNDSNEDRIPFLDDEDESSLEEESLLPKGLSANQNGTYITQNGFEEDIFENTESEPSNYEPFIFKYGFPWELEDLEKVTPKDLDIRSLVLPSSAKEALEEKVTYGKTSFGFEDELSIVDDEEAYGEIKDALVCFSTLKKFIVNYCKSRGVECDSGRYATFFKGVDPTVIKNLEHGDIKGYSMILTNPKNQKMYLMNMYLDVVDKRLAVDAFDCSKEINY